MIWVGPTGLPPKEVNATLVELEDLGDSQVLSKNVVDMCAHAFLRSVEAG